MSRTLTPSPCTKCKDTGNCNWQCNAYIKWTFDHQRELHSFFSQSRTEPKNSSKSFKNLLTY